MAGGVGGGLGGPAYKFEAGGRRRPQEDAGGNSQNPSKFKYKAGGGAGFSSSTSNTNPQSGVEPSSAKHRSPRRALGVLNNNQNVFSGSGFDQKMSMALNSSGELHSAGLGNSSSHLGGAGGGSQISWPSGAG